jgi:hypothetical protein
MAIVTEFSRVTKDRTGRPTSVTCEYCMVDIDGRPYLVLQSGGSNDRANPGKTSQIFHIDRDRGVELKALLEQQFPGI